MNKRSRQSSIAASIAASARRSDDAAIIDARIPAESEKLAALKTRKKGLMRQLFPAAEGE